MNYLSGKVDVVVPVRGRRHLEPCLESILSDSKFVNRIVVVSGDQHRPDAKRDLGGVSRTRRVKLVWRPMSHFNKGALINTGISESNSEYVLSSDSDIIWGRETVREMFEVTARSTAFVTVSSVQETDTVHQQSYSRRLGVEIRKEGPVTFVELFFDPNGGITRPGYGLVMSSRANWNSVGGMKSRFRGWGWEDQDLLIRAQLLGFRKTVAGHVLHISHGDELRDIQDGQSKEHSRNQNIARCFRELKEGLLFGDLIDTLGGRTMPQQLVFAWPKGLDFEL